MTHFTRKPIATAMVIAMAVISAMNGWGDCLCKDPDTGELLMDIGGKAIANTLNLVYPPWYIPYEDWDYNKDGVLDSAQFALLTELLCLDTVEIVHTFGPVTPVTVKKIQDDFEGNRALVKTLLGEFDEILDFLLDAAPLAISISDQMEAPVNAAALAEVIENDAFKNGSVPLTWAGLTYSNLAEFLFKAGDGALYHQSHGHLPSIEGTFNESNQAVACVGAAMLSVATPDLVDKAMNNTWYKRFERGVALKDLDWAYLQAKFALDADDIESIEGIAEEVADIAEESGIDEIPSFEDGDFVEIAEILGDAVWGEDGETLAELLDAAGGDVENFVYNYFVVAEYCPDYEDFEVAGDAIAGAIKVWDSAGNYTQFHNYYAWDLNEDGLADHLQISILAKLLCLNQNECESLPFVDAQALQDTWELNFGTAQSLVGDVADFLNEEDICSRDIAALVDKVADAVDEVADEMEVDHGSELLPPELFGGSVPAEWAGKTFNDLAVYLKKATLSMRKHAADADALVTQLC
ncbi:MAG: hypothetical protein GX117_15385, partial [Candidatus Hydrogenedentes bacterium]|nr:hypothetical protein [Candidatus Hydrogenedentota bacterium]